MTSSHLLVDTSGESLLALAEERPWAIKINRAEYNDWRGVECDSLEAVAKNIQKRPLEDINLMVTDGAAGAVAFPVQGEPVLTPGLKARVRGTVGAGDAFTAGVLAGWIEGDNDWEGALAMGIATATCAVELPGTSFGSRERVLEKLSRGG